MPENEEQVYTPKRRIKKSKYLELKKVNEKYELVLDIWGPPGDDQKTRKIKAREILQNNPDLSHFRVALTSQPTEGDSEECEGFRYWMMKEDKTPPAKNSGTEQSSGLSLTKEVTLHYPDTKKPVLPDDSYDFQSHARQLGFEEEESVGKQEEVTFGKKLAKFFKF